MINPPPDIRNIIQKTASFVAEHGIGYERKIMNEQKSSKFNFLHSASPYHAYYQHRVSEEKLGHALPPPAGKEPPPTQKVEVQQKVLVPPAPAEFMLVLTDSGLTVQDLEVMKLTAQFVARNGKSFLTGLNNRECNNPLFNFLDSHHRLFVTFTRLADMYSRILLPTKGLGENLKVDKALILERCLNRLEWEESQKEASKKTEDENEQERAIMNSIDWEDFVVVETISFEDSEDAELPTPLTLQELTSLSKQQVLDQEPSVDVEMEMDEEELSIVEESRQVAAWTQKQECKQVVQVTLHANDEEPPMKIVRNWKRPEERLPTEKTTSEMVVSPVTGELIHQSELEEHIRISLINPKYREQKERMMAKQQGTTLASDEEISRNLLGLQRPDLFGTTEEEVLDAVSKTKEASEHVVWDGHTGNITRAMKFQASTQGKLPTPSAEVAVGSQKTFHHPVILPPIPAAFPIPVALPFLQAPEGFWSPPVQPLPSHVVTTPTEEPEPKRRKLNDPVLISEAEFSSRFSPGPFLVSVRIADVGVESLKVQVLHLTMPSISESIGALKERIAGEIGVPANKQKLSGRAGFLKDKYSMAYYNIATGETLELSLKERGGKKKEQ